MPCLGGLKSNPWIVLVWSDGKYSASDRATHLRGVRSAGPQISRCTEYETVHGRCTEYETVHVTSTRSATRRVAVPMQRCINMHRFVDSLLLSETSLDRRPDPQARTSAVLM